MPPCTGFVARSLLMALLAAACGRVTDGEQLRLCRAMLPVLHAEGTELREIRVAPAALGKSGVRIDYAAREPGAERRMATASRAASAARPSSATGSS